jgi:hypothetical protein
MQLKVNRLTGKVQRSMANAKFRNWITSNAKHTSEMSVRVRLALLLPFMVLIGGCYSSHSGSLKVTVGNATFLPELSTKSGSLHLRLLETINGAVIYSPSNSCTSIWYHNKSKTSYFGIIESEDSKSLSTTISIENEKKGNKASTPQQKANDVGNDKRVTADAPIAKRCDGESHGKTPSVFIMSCNNLLECNYPHGMLSDPRLVSCLNLLPKFKEKTQNITACYSDGCSQYNRQKPCVAIGTLHAFSFPSAVTAYNPPVVTMS